jgi:hypothetical protein
MGRPKKPVTRMHKLSAKIPHEVFLRLKLYAIKRERDLAEVLTRLIINNTPALRIEACPSTLPVGSPSSESVEVAEELNSIGSAA